MTAETRPTDILTTSQGIYGFMDELTRPGLSKVLTFTTHLLPGTFQTEEYTQAIFDMGSQAGIVYNATFAASEPNLRRKRNTALLEDPRVSRTVIMSSLALRKVVGSPKITAASIRYGKSLVERSIDGGDLPQLHVAVYPPSPDTVHDVIDHLVPHSQTTSKENGHRVWVDDATILAPPNSHQDVVLPKLTDFIMARSSTVTGEGVIDLMDEALFNLERA